MQHDGLQFFPLPLGSQNSTRGLLASIMNTLTMACCMSVVWSPGQRRKSPSLKPHTAYQ